VAAERPAVALSPPPSEPAEHSGAHRGGPQDQARFRAAPGHKARLADYSQIELRLLAAIADIEKR